MQVFSLMLVLGEAKEILLDGEVVIDSCVADHAAVLYTETLKVQIREQNIELPSNGHFAVPDVSGTPRHLVVTR